MRDVQSNPLSHHGTRHVNLSVGTRVHRANIDFKIADISDNILSLVKHVPLFLHKDSLRIRANPIAHHVSPAMMEDMPLRPSAKSPLRLLDRRLDELALPKQGTKLDKWTRLEKRENELIRERKSRRRRLTQNVMLDHRDAVEMLQSR